MKVRLIDDFSQSGVNSTVQVESMPRLHTLDTVGAMMLELNRKDPHHLWIGKTFDLSSAYRQLAISVESLWCSYIVVF